MDVSHLAPAKINLFLHVGRPAADGYHDLYSLMVFADVGDRVTLRVGETGFAVTGPFAAGLEGETDNLVIWARDRFFARFGARPVGLTLDKRLPIAAGLGGGSADAAATLRLLAEAWNLPPEDRRESGALGGIARSLGADLAACLVSAPVIASGRGDRLQPAAALPRLDAVLVNPGAPSPTGAVYRAFDDDGAWGDLATVAPGDLTTTTDVVRWLASTRNDLEAPATRLSPAIGEVVATLRRSDRCLLARMSGSGATCFALCSDAAAAESLAADLRAEQPAWWIAPCQFGGAAV